MSRYLTAAKIARLVVLALYVESKVPTSSTVAILGFLLGPLIRKKQTSRLHLNESLLTPVSDFKDALVIQPSLIPGRNLWDIFLQKLWSLEDLDGLHSFFEQIKGYVGRTRHELVEETEDGEVSQTRPPVLSRTRQELVEETEDGKVSQTRPPVLSRNSPLGIFVRRACLEFMRLQFGEGATLWTQLLAWRESTYAEWKKKNPPTPQANGLAAGILKVESLTDRLYAKTDGGASSTMTSIDDVERLVGLQVGYMQKSGQRVPQDLQAHIGRMLHSSGASSTLIHYSKFLDAWKAADYTSAFENLHRYFDYSMHVSGKSYYHYALLNMAFLYADFGCYGEAIAAMHESISMARESKDMTCLNFSLSWLYNFSKEHPEESAEIKRTGVLGTDKEALALTRSKARENGSWNILSTSLLAEARVLLTNGESIASAFENISKAMYLNFTNNVDVVVGQQMLTEGTLYSRLGIGYMSWANAEISEQCYTSVSPSLDEVVIASRRAIRLMRRGRYSEALTGLEKVDSEILRVVKRQQSWSTVVNVVKLTRAFRRDDRLATERYIDQVLANSTKHGSFYLSTRMCKVELLARGEDLSAAHDLLDDLMRGSNTQDRDIHDKLLLMVVKARLYDKAGVPQKGFSHALRAASMAYHARVLEVLYMAVSALCRVLVSLKEYTAASQLLTSIMPHVLECEDCEMAAIAFSVLADAHTGLAGSAAAGSQKRKENMTKALEFLERAFDEYSGIEDVTGQCEVMAKRSMIMRYNGDIVLANDAAAKALAIREAAVKEIVG